MTAATVAVRLNLLLLARALAPSESDLVKSIDHALATVAKEPLKSERAKQLQEFASEKTGSILPFHVDQIDVQVAAILIDQLPAGQSGVVFSRLSRADAGYALVGGKTTTYVDSYVPLADQHRTNFCIDPSERESELDDAEQICSFCPTIRGEVAQLPKFRLIDDEGLREEDVDWRPEANEFQLIDPHADGAAPLLLTGLTLERSNEGALSISVNSPESMIRLSAAAGRYWLAVEMSELEMVCRVPHFDDAASSTPAWVRIRAFPTWVTGECARQAKVEIGEALAAACMRLYRWFVIDDKRRMVKLLTSQPTAT